MILVQAKWAVKLQTQYQQLLVVQIATMLLTEEVTKNYQMQTENFT